MKKAIAILLSLLILAAGGYTCYYSLFLSPNGARYPERPAVLTEQLLASTDREQWRSLLYAAWEEPVTEYENREAVFSRLFEEAAADEFRFRAHEEKNSFILSSGDRDLAVIRYTYNKEAKSWSRSDLRVLLSANTHAIRVIVPENVVPTVNGKPLGEDRMTDSALVYEDMIPLELQFDSYPLRHVYELSGLYETPSVEAEGAKLILVDRDLWSYEPLDARTHSVKILAPETAAVKLNGAVLGENEVIGTEGVGVDVDVPEELASLLPAYKLYGVTGLYTSEPAVTVEAADGKPLELSEENGVLCYRETSSTAPEPEVENLAKDFMKALCNYGAGKCQSGMPNQYVQPGTALQTWIARAQGSLFWIQGTGLVLQEPVVGEYISLNGDTCVCTVRAVGTVSSSYTSYDAEFACQLLLERTPNGWKVTDMAYE